MASTAEIVDDPEIIIGLVGPIGVDMDFVIQSLEKSLGSVGYQSSMVHLTTVLGDLAPSLKPKAITYPDRYKGLIASADKVRRYTDNNAAFACLAISEIRRLRQVSRDNLAPQTAANTPRLGTAYIIRQFKRPEEITLLRQVYGRKFIQVSVYLDKEERKHILIEKIKSYDTQIVDDAKAETQALELIEIDYSEVSDTYGQRVSDVFHLGDVFVRGEHKPTTADTIDRFIRAFFGHNGISPTKAEYGMYAAAGASLRSLDLSRQVGAAIFSEAGEVISMGCNEVPKAFGGTYWSDGLGDKYRDFEKGADGNHFRKLRIVHDLVERMGKLGYLSTALTSMGDASAQVRSLMGTPSIAESRVMDIIEFGRIIHAEMSAITDAARLGKPIGGSILFCTTFPCHMCAKHIVAAGIRRVVFLEPYPKSHAKEMHSDSITFSALEQETHVLFEPFIGISPRRYRDIFEKGKRKDATGKAVDWYAGKPVPRIEDRSSVYIDNEEPAIVPVTAKLMELAKQ